MIYDVILLGDGSAREQAKMAVFSNSVVIAAAAGDIVIDSEDFKVDLGGANDKLLFFSSLKTPPVLFCTSDKSILNDKDFLTNPRVFLQFDAIRKKGRSKLFRTLSVFSLLIIAVLFLGYILFQQKEGVVKRLVATIPIAVDKKLGEVSFTALSAQTAIDEREEVDKRIEALVKPLMATSIMRESKHKYSFHVADSKVVNAFALPGGQVVIFSELIKEADSAKEIIGVIAHEIGHVENRHSIELLLRSLGVISVVQLFLGDVAGIGAILVESSNLLTERSYSRNLELEADAFAVKLLNAAKISPVGLVDFFKKMEKKPDKNKGKSKQKSSGQEDWTTIDMARLGKIADLLSTHPSREERIKSIQNMNTIESETLDISLNKELETVKELLK